MRKIMLTAALAGALLIAAPAAAFAAGGPAAAAPAPTQTQDTYTPDDPQEPTLAGSAVIGECNRDVPWINYSVVLTDPDSQSTTTAVRLVLTDGVNTHTINLGQLVNGALSGSTLWPGASVDADGNANGWPGWVNEGGTWVETDGNFRWTRGDIDARIEVNPDLNVALSYPQATPSCATDPGPGELPLTDSLPATGLSTTVFAIAAAGGAVLLVGIAFLVVQRRRSRA